MRIKREQVNFFVTILSVLTITVHIFIFSNYSKNLVKDQIASELKKTAVSKAEQMDLFIDYGLNNIRQISSIITSRMTGPEIENPEEVINPLIQSSPFSSVDYVDVNGLNHANSRGDLSPFNVTDKEYYIEGMKGNSGIWINFNPDFSSQPLVFFYAPLYYNSEICGVIISVIGSESILKDRLQTVNLNLEILGFVVDEEFKVITSTAKFFPNGICLKDYIDHPFVQNLEVHIDKSDEDVFSYYSNKKEGICCIIPLRNCNWSIGYLTLSEEYAIQLKSYRETMLRMFLLFITVILFYMLFQLFISRRSKRKTETQFNSLMESLALIYENVAIVNIDKKTIDFYKNSIIANQRFDEKALHGNYDYLLQQYVKNQVCEEDQKLFKPIETINDLKRVLNQKNEETFVFSVIVKEKKYYFQISFIWADKKSDYVIVAIKDITELMEKDQAVKDQLNEMVQTQNSQLKLLSSMAEIYLTSYLFNLKEDTFVEFTTSNEVKEVVSGNENARQQLRSALNHVIVPEYLETAIAFSDLSTIGKRLKGKKVISEEMIAENYGWIRASFVPVENDEEGNPVKVLFLTQIIDAEKRREEKLRITANMDELTGLLNRNAFEEILKQLKVTPPEDDFVYISMDVNGLKGVNDTLGHAAGDELLCGAADCMKKCFGTYGNIYRTGGDEFQALISAESEKLKELKKDFDETVNTWSGHLVPELKISSGYVEVREFPELSIMEIGKKADERMYKAKSAYYSSKGTDRRGQQVAYEVLCQSYTKILKVNLTTDNFIVIQMDAEEKKSDKSFNKKISNWLYDFGASDYVHKDDRYDFHSKTELETMRQYFKNGNKELSVQYRRKYGNKYKKVFMEMIPTKEYTDENQVIFLYVKAID